MVELRTWCFEFSVWLGQKSDLCNCNVVMQGVDVGRCLWYNLEISH